MLNFVHTDDCRRLPLLNYFGEKTTLTECGMCDNCLSELEHRQDISLAAKKFLSCVKRTGESFGAVHVIDVLRGSRSKKVLEFRHDRLSTYGIGTEYSKKVWQHLSQQFLNKGLMAHNMDFGGLKLTSKAWDVFQDKEKVFGMLIKAPETKTPAYKQNRNSDYDFDGRLFEILRQKRKELADSAAVPPFVIFSDRTLMEMAHFFPQTRDALMNINGIGVVKAEKYGDIFLALIIGYCQNNQIKERAEPLESKTIRRTESGSKQRHILVGEAYNSGKSVAALKMRYNVKQSVVLSHLYKYLRSGHSIKVEPLLSLSKLSDVQQARVIDLLRSLGTEFLSPIYDALGGTVSYDELHLLRLYYIGSSMDKA
jgi:ATP-dependent DNA helicase RecQ